MTIKKLIKKIAKKTKVKITNPSSSWLTYQICNLVMILG
jgi:hypothetical protein